MSTTTDNNKRIAKNTLMLYIRMIFLMGVTLYTSRIILNSLGITDFGIYNVVGGFVTMLGFISGSLSGATSRFITFELGKGEKGNVKKVFQCSITIHYIFAFILFIIAETIGLWFLNEKMVIPSDRLTAALWVYQCSVATFIISILSIPYNALIIAHERMSAFAYISIFEAFSRLFIAFLIQYSNFDRLIYYSILILLIQGIVRILYSIYCKKNFSESSFKWLWDNELSKKMAAYAGWTMSGNLAVIGYTQGINILLNLFFGPTINAARGIAVQVQSAVNQCFGNFQMAVRPQITKLYAQGDLKSMHSLILNSSRYSYYLIIIMSLPIFVNTEYILHLWLGEIPDHTIKFTQIMILTCMNGAFSQPTLMAIHATGNIKKFQIIEGSLLLTVVPIAYAFLKIAHISSEYVLIIYLIIETITQFVRVLIVYPRIQLAKHKYLTDILYPAAIVSIPIAIIGYVLSNNFESYNILTFIINSSICIFSTIAIIYICGLKSTERNLINSKIKHLVKQYL